MSVGEILFDHLLEQAHSFLSQRLVFEREEDASYQPFDEWTSKRRIFHGDPRALFCGFEFKDRPRLKKGDWWVDKWWLVMTDGESDLCLRDPGFDVDLYITTDLQTMTRVWMGDIPVREALRSEAIELEGSRSLVDSFERWLPLSHHAQHERPPEPLNLERILATAHADAAE